MAGGAEVLALLADVKEAPEDDTRRLILADWLEEHGESERAELLRLQCAADRLPYNDPHKEQLEQRQEELLTSQRAVWLGPLRKRGLRYSFKRRLLHVYCEAEGLLAAQPTAPALAAWAWTETLTFYGVNDDVAGQLAASPFLAGVAELRACDSNRNLNNITAHGLAALVASPHLGKLRTLLAFGNKFGDAGAKALASGNLTNLTKLVISSNEIGLRGAAALAASTSLTRLAVLDLAGNEIGTRGAEALARSTTLVNLTTLNVSHNRMGARGAQALAASPSLARLTELEVWGNAIGNAGAIAFASSPTLANLTHLVLNDNDIGEEGVVALATSPHLTRLTHLGLMGAQHGETGAEALRHRFGAGVGS
jgi:uncharacterized protein (TIGR02996 family)